MHYQRKRLKFIWDELLLLLIGYTFSSVVSCLIHEKETMRVLQHILTIYVAELEDAVFHTDSDKSHSRILLLLFFIFIFQVCDCHVCDMCQISKCGVMPVCSSTKCLRIICLTYIQNESRVQDALIGGTEKPE